MPDCDPCKNICFEKKVKCKAPKKAGSACTGCIWAVASSLITFGLGVYTGIYVAQNYEVPKANDPKQWWEKLKNIMKGDKPPPSSPPPS